MPARKGPEPRPRSGKVHEAQRHTERVVLRLPPLEAQAIREGAAKLGLTLSAYVAQLAIAAVPEAE